VVSPANTRAKSGEITVLGLDPGLGSTGYAIAAIDLATRRISRVIKVGIVTTDRQKLKQVRQTSDCLRRAAHLTRNLTSIIAEHGVSMIAMEMCGASPHIYPTFSFGVMIGIAASLDRPIIEVLPNEVKLAATGNKKATKSEIVAWAVKKTGKRNVGWPTSRRANSFNVVLQGKYVTKAAEHPADALAAIEASLNTEQFKLALALLG
jgi:Holliday junction resolvasome RuvABC endonuclease subunit